jgi:hypothetical protein
MHPCLAMVTGFSPVAQSVHVPLPSVLAAVSNQPTGAMMVWAVRP